MEDIQIINGTVVVSKSSDIACYRKRKHAQLDALIREAAMNKSRQDAIIAELACIPKECGCIGECTCCPVEPPV